MDHFLAYNGQTQTNYFNQPGWRLTLTCKLTPLGCRSGWAASNCTQPPHHSPAHTSPTAPRPLSLTCSSSFAASVCCRGSHTWEPYQACLLSPFGCARTTDQAPANTERVQQLWCAAAQGTGWQPSAEAFFYLISLQWPLFPDTSALLL